MILARLGAMLWLAIAKHEPDCDENNQNDN